MGKPTTYHSQPTTNHPLVSVVIPVFNGASYLVEAVSSVQKSTYKDFEILLIDDGSTDQSKELCHMLEKQHKNVRYYTFQKNRGLGRVLNFALKKAQGKYICRLNQDDRMLPHRLTTQVAYMENHADIVALGSSIKLFDNKEHHQIIQFLPEDREIKEVWYIISPFADPSVMYRKDVAIKAGGYDQNFWPADDTHLWYRMGLHGNLANLNKPIVEVRWHDKAASVYYFKKLALSTFKMHVWTHKNIKAAPPQVWAFWFCQLFAGLTLSPQLNWKTYRVIKKIINAYETHKEALLRRSMRADKRMTPAVTAQPISLKRSGQYST